MASSAPILCPSVSTTSWPRQSRMFSASNMPVRLLNSAAPPLSSFYPDGSRRPLPARVVALAGLAALSRRLIGRWRYRSAGAPVFTTGPGQQFLVDEIAPQRRVVVVDGPQEPADAVFGVAHPGLEALCDLVKQQAAPRLPGGHGLDPALFDEYPQPLVGGDRIDDGCRVKVGHDHILSTGRCPPGPWDQPLSCSDWASSVTTSVSGRVAARRPLAFCQ